MLYSVIKMKRTSRFLINILLLTEQSTVMIKNLLNSPGIVLYFSKQTIGRWRYRLSSVFYTLIKHAFSNNQSARTVMSECRKINVSCPLPARVIEITGKEQALSSSAELAGKQKSLLYFIMQ